MVRLYDEKDFETVAYFWHKAQRVAMPGFKARRFHEKNGFIAEKFGMILPHESESGVEYHWRGV
jgi:hypothetical protein